MDSTPRDRATVSLLQMLLSAQERRQLFPIGSQNEPPTPVVVGVSGGADSVCLLHALRHFAKPWHLQLHVAHLDHALRPDSAEDAAFVADLARGWALDFHTERLQSGALAGAGDGLEAAARRARYKFLSAVAHRVVNGHEVATIAVGHNADDQAETVLLNLVSGSGLAGLGGMRWVSEAPAAERCAGESRQTQSSVRLVRPLLATTRGQILAYLDEVGQTWREDSSNRDPRFLRNRVRHQVVPLLRELNPNLVATLGRSAALLAAEADRSEALDSQQLEQLCLESSSPGSRQRCVLDGTGLLNLPVAAQRGVLRLALHRLGADLREAGFEQIDGLLEQLQCVHHASGPHPLTGVLAWTLLPAVPDGPARLSLHHHDALPVAPDHPYLDEDWRAAVGEMPLPLNGQQTVADWQLLAALSPVEDWDDEWRNNQQPWVAFLDADQIRLPMLTTPRPALRFAPLGLHGRHQTLGDFFTDHKTPRALRSGWPIVVDRASDRVAWVCGQRIGHEAAITPETKKVLHLRWVRREDDPARPVENEGADGRTT